MSFDIKQSVSQSYGIQGNTPKGNNDDITQVEDKNSNLENNRLFNYLETNDTGKFVMDDKSTNILESHTGKFNYVICLLLKDDTIKSDGLLEKTLDSIYHNFNTLNDLGISSVNTLVCIFVNKITNSTLFKMEDIYNVREDKNYYFYATAQKKGIQSSTIYLFTKSRELLDLEALKCYYLYVIDKIRANKQAIFSSVITVGVELMPSGLKNLVLSAYDNLKNHGVSVGLVDSSGIGVFAMIETYERTHFNIYNMNYYGMSSAFPVSSLLSTMYIDNNVSLILKNYYSLAYPNQTIDYHDYNLGIHLYQNNINVKFYQKEVSGTLITDELEYTDYQEIWVNRYSGYYGNTFELLKELINMNNFNLVKKLILFFHIIGILIEFIYPSLSSMVIYSIFYEAFNTVDYRLATFFTMLYIFMLVASGMCSLVTKRPDEMKMTNMFIFFFMEVYYLFILICSIVAMDTVKKNKDNNEYQFNNGAISCIIIFTFLPYIVPMLLNIQRITQNIVNMLTYIGLGAPSSTSNLLMAQVWNASDASGGNEKEERKSFVLFFFFLFNLFFGSLTFYNYTRRKRAECVMGFGIFYLIYNFFKTIGIVLKILGQSDEANDSSKNARIVAGIKNMLGKDDDNDMGSEEKKLNNVNFSNEYNNDSINNDNNNNDNNNHDDNDDGYEQEQ